MVSAVGVPVLICAGVWGWALALQPTFHYLLPNEVVAVQIVVGSPFGHTTRLTNKVSDIRRLVSSVTADVSYPARHLGREACSGAGYWGSGVLLKFWSSAKTVNGRIRTLGRPTVVGLSQCGIAFVRNQTVESYVPKSNLENLGVGLPEAAGYQSWLGLTDVGNAYGVARELAAAPCTNQQVQLC